MSGSKTQRFTNMKEDIDEKAPALVASKTSGDDDEEIDEDRYDEDADYRLSCGPSMELWGESGFDESLVGLQITLDFGIFGKSEGVVKSFKKSRHNDDSIFNVIWTCEEKEYDSELMTNDVVGWYHHGRERPSWLDDETYIRGTKSSSLFSIKDEETKLKNFELPCEAAMFFPWAEEESDKWDTTIYCLNDPACARFYDPSGKMAYPLSLLLTLIVLCTEYDPSTKLPMVVSKEKEHVFELADEFASRINEDSAQLAELQDIVKAILSATKKAKKRKTLSDNEWKALYEKCEALILTMSRDFEKEHDGWYMWSDPVGVYSVCANLVMALGGVLLHAPSPKMKELLAKDRAHLAHHLKEGNFVTFVEEGIFQEEHPKAAKVWEQLTSQFGE